MSLDIAIDAALKRGANPVSISRLLGVSIASVEKRAKAMQERVERMLHARRIQQIERELGLTTPQAARVSDEAAMEEWVERGKAMGLRFEDAPEPRWNAGAAARNDAILARRRETPRTMGGVADYSSVPEAA